LIVAVLGIAALALAIFFAACDWNTPTTAPWREFVKPRDAFVDSLRTVARVMAAGVVAGVLVPGLGGRLFMRLMAATSGASAQGLTTEADEIVGEVTQEGSIAVVVFVGLAGGALAALGWLLVRRAFPGRAGPAGIIAGVILLGTIGVGDAMSPDNVDFRILEPHWLAVTGIVVLALLFGVTFTALAARLETRPVRAGWASYILFLIPPFFLVPFLYVGGRVLLRGRGRAFSTPAVRLVGSLGVALMTGYAAVASTQAIVEIV